MLRPDVQALLAYLESAPGVETGTPEQAREAMRAGGEAADLPPVALAVERSVEIPTRSGTIAGLWLDRRETRDPGPVVLWFHGGGFVTGGLDTHRAFAGEVADQLDLPVLLVDYRLAPEHVYPAPIEDAEDAARWVASAPPALPVVPDALVLGGDSAGGTLAIVTAMALRDNPAAVPVNAHMTIYPATDYTRTYPSEIEFAHGRLLTEPALRWYDAHYRPDVNDWRASPLIGSGQGLPPAVVLTAEEDPLRDEGRAYASRLIEAGVPTTYLEAAGHIHAFVVLRKAIPSTQDDLRRAFSALSATVRAAREAG